MENLQRPIVVFTSFGKKYAGTIDIPTESMRTTDLLNGTSIFWKNPNEKCFDDAILMNDVKLMLEEKAVYKHYNSIQIKTSEIIFFYDSYESIGDAQEKSRAVTMREKSKEEMKSVSIITPLIANSFYDIQGKFYGLFKKKSQDKFIPIFDATVVEIQKVEGKWTKKSISLAHSFLGISNKHIEALTFE